MKLTPISSLLQRREWQEDGAGHELEEFKRLSKNGKQQRNHCVSELRQLPVYRSLFS